MIKQKGPTLFCSCGKLDSISGQALKILFFVVVVYTVAIRLRPPQPAPCQRLTAGWDVRGPLFTLMMTHCGVPPLIVSPALWIKNTLWLTRHTLWPFETWQRRERHVCHVEKAAAAEGQVGGKHSWADFNIQPRTTPIMGTRYHPSIPRRVRLGWSRRAFDQHPQLFKSAARKTDWVSYSLRAEMNPWRLLLTQCDKEK